MSAPAVSVAMGVCNGERLVADAVESILSQTLRDLELVIVDDGSTDATPSILDRYARRDSRIVVLRQENCALARSLNRAILTARPRSSLSWTQTTRLFRIASSISSSTSWRSNRRRLSSTPQ